MELMAIAMLLAKVLQVLEAIGCVRKMCVKHNCIGHHPRQMLSCKLSAMLRQECLSAQLPIKALLLSCTLRPASNRQ